MGDRDHPVIGLLDDGSALSGELRQWCTSNGWTVERCKHVRELPALAEREDVTTVIVSATLLADVPADFAAGLSPAAPAARVIVAVARDATQVREAQEAGIIDVLLVEERFDEAQRRSLDHLVARAHAVRQLHERVAQLESRLTLAQAGSEDGLWEWDVKEDRLYLSRRWWELLGFDQARPETSTIEEWFSRVHPADLGRLRGELGAFVHSGGDADYVQDAARVLRKDGLWSWMRTRAVAERNEAGVAVRLAGTMAPMRYDGTWDWLTGLPNRLLFEEQAAVSASYLQQGQMGAIVYLGIDRLNVINETMGHGAGDLALRTIASRIEASLRPGDIAGRFSGDEFAVCLAQVPNPEFARTWARDLLVHIARPQHAGTQTYAVTASAGLSLFERPSGELAQQAIDEARAAMHVAKESGGNTLVEYQTGMKESLQRAVSLQRRLERALEDQEFQLWYQPIYLLGRRRQRLAGFEALIRWRPTRDSGLYRSRDLVAPAHFIPFAEESGQIIEIGAWVIREALRQAASWVAGLGLSRLPVIAVNLSARQFADDRLVQRVDDELARSGLPPAVLRFELTETMLVQDFRVSLDRMNALRDLGVSLTLDDFGTGYSSLSYLHRYPVGALKIDQSFVRGIDTGREKQQIVRTIVTLARSLNMNVVAEGIENRTHLRFVRGLGCGYGQGMLLGRPQAPESATALLADARLAPDAVLLP